MLKNNTKKGFTLIELLIVVTIIVLIASVVIGYVSQVGIKGRDSRRKQNIDQIAKAINLFFNDKGYLPQNATGWCTYISNSNSGLGQAFQADLEPYMKNIPLDPNKAGSVGDYLFSNTDNTGGKYTLCANLEASTGNNYDFSGCLGGAVYNYCITQ